MTTDAIRSIPAVCDVTLLRGPQAGDGPPDLLLEVPHGATRAEHFRALRAELRGAFPDDLEHFFFVNTDVGAPEVAARVAERFVARAPERSALLVRCLVPRTFVDCNRVIDLDAVPRASAAGEMTPGLHAYVQDEADRRLLLTRYAAYRDLVDAAFARVCGGGGLALIVHSYAPRSIDVPVDERIVDRLRAEYAPERIVTWPLRPEVDLIVDAPDGATLGSASLISHGHAALGAAGFEVARGGTYRLHPGTMGHRFAQRYPDRTLCLELRRDLLVAEFTPFAEMAVDAAKIERAAGALEEAARHAFADGRSRS